MLAALIWLAGLIFAAGAAWKTLRDLKGMSGKINRQSEKEDRRFFILAVAVIQALPEEKKQQYTAMLYEAMK